jgi:hypothetical protein
MNKNSSIIIKKETGILNIKEQKLNRLLESKLKENEHDNQMMIIENEQILKDEIYIQKMTKYEDEFLIKKTIQFNNEINLDDLKMQSICVEKKNSTKQDIYDNQQFNESDNIIEYEKEFEETNSQSNLDKSSFLNSPTPIFTKGRGLDNQKTLFYNLQKNSYDSKDESLNNSNNTLNTNNINLSPNQKKIRSGQSTDNKNINSSQKHNNNKKNLTKENSNVELKKNLFNDKEIDLIDSLDTFINNNSKNKYRNSLDDKSESSRNTKNYFDKSQVKNFNDDKNNLKISSSRKANEINYSKKQKVENVKRNTLNNNKAANVDIKKQANNSYNNVKKSEEELGNQTINQQFEVNNNDMYRNTNNNKKIGNN